MWTDPQPSSISILLCQTFLRSVTAPHNQMDYLGKNYFTDNGWLVFPTWNTIGFSLLICKADKQKQSTASAVLSMNSQHQNTDICNTYISKLHAHGPHYSSPREKRSLLGGIHLASLPGLQAEAGTTRCDSSDTSQTLAFRWTALRLPDSEGRKWPWCSQLLLETWQGNYEGR